MEKLEREIRFAVVMYGGISLAIYMNGIAEELLQMVRATGNRSDKNNTGLKGSSLVYRKVADLLDNGDKNPFTHKFVIDIISGTSAGGINGICLAKGLVQGSSDLKSLRNIWIQDGDVSTLLNDSKSDRIAGKKYRSARPETSLFNSQRMYGLLLKAFSEMEKEPGKVPLAGSMDLYVTATDLYGIQQSLQIEGQDAYEHSYKHVFPFSFRTETETLLTPPPNCFTKKHDSMLAFAARCTSSFPLAFEPVTLDSVLDQLSQQSPEDASALEEHASVESRFFRKYAPSPLAATLRQRPFADGGYLDNRPFGHAIEAIHARTANCSIQRKLLFIDPRPETRGHDEIDDVSFFKNAQLAAFTLPGYEPIREEISTVQKRNKWLREVRTILDKVQDANKRRIRRIIYDDFERFRQGLDPSTRPDTSTDVQQKTLSDEEKYALIDVPPDQSLLSGQASQQALNFWKNIVNAPFGRSSERRHIPFEQKGMAEMTQALGDIYPAYHFTKISKLDQLLTAMLASACGLEESPAEMQHLEQELVSWRKQHFVTYLSETAPGIESENTYLLKYDLGFRIRRLNYFRELLLEIIKHDTTNPLTQHIAKNTLRTEPNKGPVQQRQLQGLGLLYKTICSNLKQLYLLRDLLLTPGTQHPLYESSNALPGLLKGNQEQAAIHALLDTLMDKLHNIVMNGPSGTNGTVAVSNAVVEQGIDQLGKTFPETAGRLKYLYLYGYDLEDASTYQLLADGNVAEGSIIDIERVSPADAHSLWNEAVDGKKLAGLALGGFGGFLDWQWRYNDIMWGRLDASELLITTLLRESNVPGREKAALIAEAQKAILEETMTDWSNELIRKGIEASPRLQDQHKRLQHILHSIQCGGTWQETFKSCYRVDHDPEPEPSLDQAGRAAAVLSSMIDGTNNGKGITGRLAMFLKYVASFVLGLLDFSSPKNIRGSFVRYWLQLLFLVSVVMLIGGYLIPDQLGNTLTVAGLVLLGAVLLFSVVLKTVRFVLYAMNRKKKQPACNPG